MPTQEKVDRVNELKEKLERCSVAVTTDYTRLGGNELTDLRRRMRAAGIEFIVVKNTLASLAAEAARRPQVKEIVQGPTAIALGYSDPVDVARMLSDYIRTTRSLLAIRGAVLGDGPALPADDVIRLATLPSREQLVANLLGQMQAPIQRLLAVMNGPVTNLALLLQARVRQLESAEASS